MKKVPILLGMVSAFLLVFVFACTASTPNTDANATSSQTAKFKSHSYKGNSLIKYPEVYGIDKNAATKINTTFKTAAEKTYQSYLNVKKKEKAELKKGTCRKNPATKKCKYSVHSLYKVKYNSNGKLSIYYSEYTYTGGSGGKSRVTLYNFNLATGKQYKINDILKTSKNYKKVQNYAYKYLSTHKPYSSSITKLSDVPVNKNTQFIFTKDGIYLYFTNYKGFFEQYDNGDPFIKISKKVYE